MRLYKTAMTTRNELMIVEEIAAHRNSVTGKIETCMDEEGLSREQIEALEGGPEALAAWVSGDDFFFAADQELVELAGTAEDLFMSADKGDPDAIAFLEAHAEELHRFSAGSRKRSAEESAAAERAEEPAAVVEVAV